MPSGTCRKTSQGIDPAEREFFIDNLLVRIHFIIVMIWWTGFAPWEFEFLFSGSLISTFLDRSRTHSNADWMPTTEGSHANNYFTEMCSGFEAGSYLMLIDLCKSMTIGPTSLLLVDHPIDMDSFCFFFTTLKSRVE